LDSLHAVPLESLSSLDIIRREAPPSLHCGVAIYDGIVDDAVALKPIPPAFMDQIKQHSFHWTSFRCDFFCFSIGDIKVLLESSPKLKVCDCYPDKMTLILSQPTIAHAALFGRAVFKVNWSFVYFLLALEFAHTFRLHHSRPCTRKASGPDSSIVF
jgi:hypothetical protein